MAIKVRRGKLYPPIEFEQAAELGLDEVEWEKIVDRLGRPPNHFEASIFAALWSETVSNKSSSALLEAMSRDASGVHEIPGTTLSITPLGDGASYLSLRLINNNAQTYYEPYYGVQTAMGSALEELASVGALPLCVLNLLRFGTSDRIRNQTLFQSAVQGIGDYGCRYGLPVLGGELYFHENYNSSPMVNSGVVGVIRHPNVLDAPEVDYQSPVLYVGASTGRDGLKLESKNDTDDIISKRRSLDQMVRMSDPLLGNRLINACAEAIEKRLVKEVVSVGYGGLAVACFNLAKRINKPILLDIDRIPLRGAQMEPLEIVLSESSQRVLLVVDKGKHRALNQILHKWDLSSLKVGDVNDADGIEFYYNHYLAADIPFLFALGGSIQKQYEVVKFPPMLKRSRKDVGDADSMRRRKRKVEDEWSLVREISLAKDTEEKDKEILCPDHLDDVWLDLLANPNLCSRAPAYRQFDQVIGANTVQKIGGDAALLRIRPFMGWSLAEDTSSGEKSKDSTEKGLAVTLDANSLYVSMEPYLGTVQTVAESMRNLAAVGARPVGMACCMNFGDPNRYQDVCDLSESLRGLGDASKIWRIPLLSKEISLNNGSEGNPALPTPSVLMAGLLGDLKKSCSVGFKNKGDKILLVGLTENEIGCSEYAYFIHKFINRLVPDIDFEKEKETCELIASLIQDGMLQSAHDISSGGIAISIIESCMMRTRPIGAVLHIEHQTFETPNGPIPLRADSALFSETSGRFLISCKPELEEKVRNRCETAGIPLTGSGTVGGKFVRVEGAVETELPISTTYKLWNHRLANLLGEGQRSAADF